MPLRVPPAQAVQLSAPSAAAKVPIGQREQVMVKAAAALNVPAGQGMVTAPPGQ